MTFDNVTPGRDVPNDVNVVIEIPANSNPVKYELDKKTGAITVDRFMATSMHYPCNYGYVPRTLSEDGDPVDVLVLSPFELLPGAVVRSRPVGMLEMTDEAGRDTKILAVPIDKLTPLYHDIREPEDVNAVILSKISHFFEHYKDLEQGKWVKIMGWANSDSARKEITDSIQRYKDAPEQPAF